MKLPKEFIKVAAITLLSMAVLANTAIAKNFNKRSTKKQSSQIKKIPLSPLQKKLDRYGKLRELSNYLLLKLQTKKDSKHEQPVFIQGLKRNDDEKLDRINRAIIEKQTGRKFSEVRMDKKLAERFFVYFAQYPQKGGSGIVTYCAMGMNKDLAKMTKKDIQAGDISDITNVAIKSTEELEDFAIKIFHKTEKVTYKKRKRYQPTM